ncbi:NineTeen Complex (NTC) component [Physocladia obscura]|uniref:NineTeen Complex (NTC) component n=1 Tax=Physocladia obscura TaxID=109957 RepID=A0AAD5T6L7_9FUNG|nr:NineTeen Complex (NTC) component [Physocladia obscura]
MVPRIPYVPENVAGQVADQVRERRGSSGLLELDRVLLHAPAIAQGWNQMFGAIRSGATLPAILREIIMCRIAVLNTAEYEWSQHTPILRDEGGATDNQIQSLRSFLQTDPSAYLFFSRIWQSEKVALVIEYTDSVTRDVNVTDELFERLRPVFSNQELVEITATVAGYNMVSRFLVALKSPKSLFQNCSSKMSSVSTRGNPFLFMQRENQTLQVNALKEKHPMRAWLHSFPSILNLDAHRQTIQAERKRSQQSQPEKQFSVLIQSSAELGVYTVDLENGNCDNVIISPISKNSRQIEPSAKLDNATANEKIALQPLPQPQSNSPSEQAHLPNIYATRTVYQQTRYHQQQVVSNQLEEKQQQQLQQKLKLKRQQKYQDETIPHCRSAALILENVRLSATALAYKYHIINSKPYTQPSGVPSILKNRPSKSRLRNGCNDSNKTSPRSSPDMVLKSVSFSDTVVVIKFGSYHDSRYHGKQQEHAGNCNEIDTRNGVGQIYARNEEKAQSMLYRFREAQMAELGIGIKNERRPGSSAGVTTVREADKWRGDIIREISRKVSKIQDPGLTEYQVRDLNDKINKLFRDKRHWEYRIKELGGPDYRRGSSRVLDAEGKEVPGSRGYRYFGRAKELPGVKELFEQQQTLEETPKTRGEMYKAVDADYYGYRDEDDGKLVEYESGLRLKMYAKALAYDLSEGLGGAMDEEGEDPSVVFETSKNVYKFVDESIPTLTEVEAWIVRRKKQELLDQFLGSA